MSEENAIPLASQTLADMVLDPRVTDTELGSYLLSLFIADEAVRRGVVPEHTVDEHGRVNVEPAEFQRYLGFVETVLRAIPKTEAQSAENAAVEKAMHKAAAGDYANAGRLLREHMLKGAEHMAVANALVRDRAQRRAGGVKRSAQRAAQSVALDALILRKRDELLKRGTKPHELAGKLSIAFDLDASTIRKKLRKAGDS